MKIRLFGRNSSGQSMIWKFKNESQAFRKEIVSTKYEEEDNWTIKLVVTPYGDLSYPYGENSNQYKYQSG